ncbi:hypothetical protein J2809_004203 [Arthrobacter pascens]|uniref:hypothetical protein n=1 Tax=Arthrobacter pascens TaxID=1677 RepID=UPI002856AEE8|nr:hypothetical protein [Arthrobacter pascens]MDR6559820.1 hypothetical protein [Arthrobacter pascens]
MDKISYLAKVGTAPGLPRLMASLIEEWDPSDAGLRRLTQRLHERGAVQEFFDFARRDEVWAAMQARGIDYDVLLSSVAQWDPLYSVRMFAGALAGAGWSVASLPFVIIEALTALAGSAFNGTLAHDAAKLSQFVKGVLCDPDVRSKIGQEWMDSFSRKVARRQWEAAGYQLGELVVDVLDIAVGVVKIAGKGGRILADASKTIDTLPTAGSKEILRQTTPADAEQIAAVIKREEKIAPTSVGAVERVGDDVVMVDPNGEPVSRSPVTEEFAAEAIERIDALEANPGGATAEAFSRSVSALSGLIHEQDRIATAVRQIVPEGAAEVGRDLGSLRHAAAYKLLKEVTQAYPWIEHYPKTKLRDLRGFSPQIADLTVQDFFISQGLDLELVGPKGGYPVNRTGLVGDLELDHASIDPTTQMAVVWDLTSRPQKGTRHDRHLAKTILYGHTLVSGLGQDRVGWVVIAESYHNRYTRP